MRAAATEDVVATRTLTPAQREIIKHLLSGSTNRTIARRLGISEQRVKNQLTVIYETLGIRSRLELALYAVRHPAIARHEERQR